MKKDSSNYFENIKVINIIVEEDTSHKNVLIQAIDGLVQAGFAPEKEIMEEWKMLLSVELENS